MTQRLSSLLAGFLLLVASVIVCAANIKIENWHSKNGSKVYFVKTTALPMVDVRVVFAAGSAYDGQHWGQAAFVNNMLGQATRSKSSDEIANDFDNVGAVFNTSIDQDKAIVSLRTLTASKYYKPAIATFVDVLAHAKFDNQAYQLILNQTLASIKALKESPDSVAAEVFNKTLYGDQPYGHPVDGTNSTVQALTLETINQFYKNYYVAKNADIVIVGDLSRGGAENLANELSDALPSGSHAKALAAMQPAAKDKTVHVEFPSKQTAIVLGQLGITRKNSDYFPLIVGNSILGQLPLSSLLFQNVRNTRGLAYYAVSSFDVLQYKGPFEIQLKTRAEKTSESVTVVKQTLSDFVKNGPTKDELKIAKDYINGSFPLSTATNSAILSAVTNIAFYNRSLDFMDTYLKKVNAVTASEIKNAFEKTLSPKNMILVTVGPKV
jgi:zinc protease